MGCTSNERRSERRQQCREALSAHLSEKLGLVVPPNRVRLQPSKEDGYAWSALSSKRYLLEKNLASCTVGLYVEIMKELGKSLEAVLPMPTRISNEARNVSGVSDGSHVVDADTGSFTAIINELKDENQRLAFELESCQASLQEVTCKYEKERTKAQDMELLLGSLSSRILKLKNPFCEANRCVDEVAQVIQNSALLLDVTENACGVKTSALPSP